MQGASSRSWRGRLVLLAALGGLAGPSCAGTAVVTVSAFVLSKSNCRITSGATATIDFLNVDPTGTAILTKTAPMSLACQGSSATATFAITTNSGLNPGSTGPRMLNGTDGSFLPYTFSVSPSSLTVNKGDPTPFTASATLMPADYSGASAGAYSDTITITLSP